MKPIDDPSAANAASTAQPRKRWSKPQVITASVSRETMNNIKTPTSPTPDQTTNGGATLFGS
ncbi:MAG TPA: hypothetical protein VNU97_02825 [Rhizomicrobium sp.]|jgi:hypothetical protein|nr:hypothetical protein [Rhizomicrobium sp.]